MSAFLFIQTTNVKEWLAAINRKLDKHFFGYALL
jgi:hypothetical protein